MGSKIFDYFILSMLLLAFTNCRRGDKSHTERRSHLKEDSLSIQIKPIIWGSSDLSCKQDLVEFENGTREPHPLDLGKSLVYAAYKYEQTNDSIYKNLSRGYLNFIEKICKNPKYYDGNTFKYNFAHGKLKPGWWSGMANSAIIFGLTYSDKVYKTNHETLIGALIKNLGTDYRNGGCLFSINESTSWILEYAWPSIDENSVKFVLNGFLYSLVCLKMANALVPNPDLESLFQRNWQGLTHKIDEYYFDGVPWTKYDLKSTIEPPHYAIFDIILLESLSNLVEKDKEWLSTTLKQRKKILKKNYPLDIHRSDDNGADFTFSLIGAPNPYWIDIYPIKIIINYKNDESEIVSSYPPKNFDIDIHKRGFVNFSLDSLNFSNIESITVNSEYLRQKQCLYTYDKDELQKIISKTDLPAKLEIDNLTVKYDAVFKDSKIIIEPSRTFDNAINNYKNTAAQIVLKFKETLPIKKSHRLAIQIENEMAIVSHKFFIHLDNGEVYQHYNKAIAEGKNTLIVDPNLFKGFSGEKHIQKIVWQVYTSDFEKSGAIKVERAYSVNSDVILEKIRLLNGERGQTMIANALSAKFDAILEDSIFKIDSKRVYANSPESYKSGIAQIVIPLTESLIFKETDNLILRFENDFEISNHKFLLYGKNGKTYQRYYIQLPKGKNVIALNTLGFPGFDIKEGIDKIVWQIYTSKMDVGTVKIDNIFKTNSNGQLQNALNDPSYNFEEKKIRGNIY